MGLARLAEDFFFPENRTAARVSLGACERLPVCFDVRFVCCVCFFLLSWQGAKIQTTFCLDREQNHPNAKNHGIPKNTLNLLFDDFVYTYTKVKSSLHSWMVKVFQSLPIFFNLSRTKFSALQFVFIINNHSSIISMLDFKMSLLLCYSLFCSIFTIIKNQNVSEIKYFFLYITLHI